MTQEEKAKAYDEAIEKLRNLHDNYDTVSTLIDIKEELKHIFLELTESDKKIKKEITELVIVMQPTWKTEKEFHRRKELCDWLEKQGQKPAWSEEDEKMKDLIISVLEVNHSKGIFKVGLRAIRTEEIVSWLKSLKQRYTWKPSKEQMDAMQMAVSYFDYSWVSKEQKLLESLYKDLKKL